MDNVPVDLKKTDGALPLEVGRCRLCSPPRPAHTLDERTRLTIEWYSGSRRASA